MIYLSKNKEKKSAGARLLQPACLRHVPANMFNTNLICKKKADGNIYYYFFWH